MSQTKCPIIIGHSSYLHDRGITFVSFLSNIVNLRHQRSYLTRKAQPFLFRIESKLQIQMGYYVNKFRFGLFPSNEPVFLCKKFSFKLNHCHKLCTFSGSIKALMFRNQKRCQSKNQYVVQTSIALSLLHSAIRALVILQVLLCITFTKHHKSWKSKVLPYVESNYDQNKQSPRLEALAHPHLNSLNDSRFTFCIIFTKNHRNRK